MHPWNENIKQNHPSTVTKAITVWKPRACIYYDTYYGFVLNMILDMSERREKEGEKGQEEDSRLILKNKRMAITLLEKTWELQAVLFSEPSNGEMPRNECLSLTWPCVIVQP